MLIVLSLDHRRASVAEREPFALPKAERVRLATLVRRTCGGQVAFLVTCNRTEVVAWVTAAHAAEAMARVSGLARRLSPLADRFISRAAVYDGYRAARHLFQVAAGLESQLAGDTQVLGQVRSAYQFAVESGAVGAELHRLFQTALRAGKRVHAETPFGRQDTTLGGAAVSALLDGWALKDSLAPGSRLRAPESRSVAARRLVILGAGKTAESAARVALRSGVHVTIVNRTHDRAQVLADRLGAATGMFEERHRIIAEADVVIVATAAPAPTVLAAELAMSRGAESDRPLVIADLGMPRNVEPGVAALPSVTLRGLEFFHPETTEPTGRPEGRPAAEQVVEEEVALLTAWLSQRQQRVREVA